MHDPHVWCGAGQFFPIQAPEAEILPLGGRHDPVHALQLQSKHHDHVAVGNAFSHVMENADAPAGGFRGHEGWRSDQPDFGAHHLQQADIGSRHATVQDIATDGDPQSGNPSKGAAHGQGVQQGLGRMFVLTVPGVDHRA